MASNLACVGLGVEDEQTLFDLVSETRRSAELLGSADGVKVFRWEDPSGARLVYALRRGGELAGLLPSFAAEPGALLADVEMVTEEVASADVVDPEGDDVLTRLTLELEQARFLRAVGGSAVGPASLVALGFAVAAFQDAAAFSASDASLFDPDVDKNAEPPPHYVEHGLVWPMRVAEESFMSYGIFCEAADANAVARFAGVVVAASLERVALTGQQFVAARVRCIGLAATLCYPFDSDVPRPGSVIAGDVLTRIVQ